MNRLQNPIKRTRLLAFLLLFPFLFSSCADDDHNDERGLSVSLFWLDAEDESTEVKDVRLWIYGAEGTVAASLQGSAQEIASKCFLLPKGEYKIFATTNLLPPLTLEPSTGVAEFGADLKIKLQNTTDVKQNAFFGITSVSIPNPDAYTVVKVSQKGALAQLSFLIEGMPAGTRLIGTVKNAASCVYPMLQEADGEYGKACEESEEMDFAVPGTLDESGRSQPVLLMPTVSSQKHSRIFLRLLLADGTEKITDIKAPLMKVGGKYQIQLKYEDISPYMYLSSVKIDDWTEGWIYNGEILNPEE